MASRLVSFGLGTTCGVARGQGARPWEQTGLYPPVRTRVRLTLWKTVHNARTSFLFTGKAYCTVIHNPQALLQVLKIYTPSSITSPPATRPKKELS